MPAPVYSYLLLGGTVASTTADIGPVPDGYTWVVTDVEITVGDLLADFITFDWGFQVVSTGSLWLPVELGLSLSAKSTKSWSGRFVLEEGETLQLFVDNGSLDVFVSGYKLTNAP